MEAGQKGMKSKKIFAVHPGEILREEFMKPLGISSSRLAKALHVSVPRINDIVLERRSITADTAVRLGRYFPCGPEVWMNMQATYDICQAQKSKSIAAICPLSEEVPA